MFNAVRFSISHASVTSDIQVPDIMESWRRDFFLQKAPFPSLWESWTIQSDSKMELLPFMSHIGGCQDLLRLQILGTFQFGLSPKQPR